MTTIDNRGNHHATAGQAGAGQFQTKANSAPTGELASELPGVLAPSGAEQAVKAAQEMFQREQLDIVRNQVAARYPKAKRLAIKNQPYRHEAPVAVVGFWDTHGNETILYEDDQIPVGGFDGEHWAAMSRLPGSEQTSDTFAEVQMDPKPDAAELDARAKGLGLLHELAQSDFHAACYSASAAHLRTAFSEYGWAVVETDDWGDDPEIAGFLVEEHDGEEGWPTSLNEQQREAVATVNHYLSEIGSELSAYADEGPINGYDCLIRL